MGVKDRLARLLAGTGVTDVALRLRARAHVPYLTILTYHHIADPGPDYLFDPDVADATPEQFARQLDLLQRHFTVIGVDELCDALDGAKLPPNPAMITFDDGYRSCHDTALPLLAERGLRAVFFIPTWYIEERRLFWWERIRWTIEQARRSGVHRLQLDYPDRVGFEVEDAATPGALVKIVKHTRGLDVERFLGDLSRAAEVAWSDEVEHGLADELLMTWDQIRAMADAGMDIESHTRRHRVLQTLGTDELAAELAGSRADLERVLGRAPRTVAYPVGRSIVREAAIRDAVEAAGYRAGFTNASGANWLGLGGRNHLDRFDISRLAVDRDLTDTLFEGQLAFPQLAHRHVPRS